MHYIWLAIKNAKLAKILAAKIPINSQDDKCDSDLYLGLKKPKEDHTISFK